MVVAAFLVEVQDGALLPVHLGLGGDADHPGAVDQLQDVVRLDRERVLET